MDRCNLWSTGLRTGVWEVRLPTVFMINDKPGSKVSCTHFVRLHVTSLQPEPRNAMLVRVLSESCSPKAVL
jgi:hypothetical protein